MPSPARPDRDEPLVAAPAADVDDAGWMVTFSDLVLQLFAFVLVGALGGGAVRALPAPRVRTPPAASEVVHASAAARVTAERAAPAALEPATAWAAESAPPIAPAAAPTPRAPALPSIVDADLPAPAPPSRAEPLRALGDYLGAFVAARGDADEATVTTGGDDIRLAFGGRLGFRPGSVELMPGGRTLLREVRRLASEVPQLAIEVAGYTDDVPIHTREFPSNLELSLARAARVARELEREDPTLAVRTVALGFGEHHAVAPNDGPENRARNRRVEVRLVARDQSMP
jgi:flagellar motor protein MotB